ncbi:uncharacterized protein LOC116619587 [Nematostella vectensis]|uniref:uncharacterized protein LOC116619587 n=1 Tax=Nematostella vectensis TaxID=45351 RepID=UPI0020775E91|nr:uncharacterized protein LOC116619587 [Nematostella vectensis]
MSSVGSRAEFPNRVYTPSPEPCDDPFFDHDTEPFRPRKHSSYEEMNGFTKEGQLHQYEDPRGLLDQVKRLNQNPPPCGDSRARPRKKMNDLYERCRADSEICSSSENSHHKSQRRCKGMPLCVLIAILFGIGALALSVLVLAGILVPKACSRCLTEDVHTDASVSASSSTAQLLMMVRNLHNNVTHLSKKLEAKEAVIKRLLRSDDEQNHQLLKLAHPSAGHGGGEIEILRGPHGFNGSRGPPGIQGPQGERGPMGPRAASVNFSSCVYREKSTAFTPSAVSGHDVSVREPKGWVVMAAVCSTEGAVQSNLKRLQAASLVQYNCQCRGRDTSYPSTARCYIHYWLCPK